MSNICMYSEARLHLGHWGRQMGSRWWRRRSPLGRTSSITFSGCVRPQAFYILAAAPFWSTKDMKLNQHAGPLSLGKKNA